MNQKSHEVRKTVKSELLIKSDDFRAGNVDFEERTWPFFFNQKYLILKQIQKGADFHVTV